MNTANRIYSLLAVSLLATPLAGQAESWSCRHDNDVREIHIERETSEPVPCRVVYKKLTEGVEDQVLWTAQNDVNYCDTKAREFVEKQISWGWTCVETIAGENPSDEAQATE